MWHGALLHVPRMSRYTIGATIDELFIKSISLSLRANFARRDQKRTIIIEISDTLDQLKYFLTILLELKAIQQNRYADIAQRLVKIGGDLGKWLKSLTPNENGGQE